MSRPRTLHIRVVYEGGYFAAIEAQTGLYGTGDTFEEAWADLASDLIACRDDLAEAETQLAPGLVATLALLRATVAEPR